MSHDAVVERVKKLLALSKSPNNAQEAAVAAAMAQRLIERYKIEACVLTEETDKIEDETVKDAIIYTFAGPRVISWILNLATGLGDVNSCRVWFLQGGRFFNSKIEAAGTESDLSTITYMTEYLVREVERLCKEAMARDPYAKGKSWSNSFKLGATVEICSRLRQAVREAREEMKAPADGYAEAVAAGDIEKTLELDQQSKFNLVRVETAIAKARKKSEAADEWSKKKYPGKWRHRGDAAAKRGDAYRSGREAGKKVALSGHKRLG